MIPDPSHTAVIIVAAGEGRRFGGDRPKQFVDIDGRPMLMLAVERIRQAMPGAKIIIALHGAYFDLWHELAAAHPDFDSSGITLTKGGATRWESVHNALTIIPDDAAIVMVHDAARPLVDAAVTDRLLEAVGRGARGVVPVVPVSDSLRIAGDGGSRAIDRSAFRAVQTPQAFPRTIIEQAYRQPYRDTFTDDASVVEALYPESIAMVEGSVNTIKLTHPADLAAIRYILANEH
ncbi:MAG: 2-C-methyl-D-erythritol 4-phosphate cytidylyltransferase [Paramuribaculum sp.]|nr:2-C-methyl-D-erythritol 4-phosphate cytidylyltransferase [Paramuribaculum sp.]